MNERISTGGEDVEEVGGEGGIFEAHGVVFGRVAAEIIDRTVPDEFLIDDGATAGEIRRRYKGDAGVHQGNKGGIVFFVAMFRVFIVEICTKEIASIVGEDRK